MTIFESIYDAGDPYMPTKAHKNDAGWDLYMNGRDDVVWLKPLERFLCPTGVRLIPGSISGGVGLVCPRSGLAHKKGVTVLNAPGIVDQDYSGEIMVNLINLSNEEVGIERGDRIGQLVVVPLMSVGVEDEGLTVRGSGGHGSSGR